MERLGGRCDENVNEKLGMAVSYSGVQARGKRRRT
jgi:hypothetical protein